MNNIIGDKLIMTVIVSLLILGAWGVPGTRTVSAQQDPGQTTDLYANSAKSPWIALNENTGNHRDGDKKANSDAGSKKAAPAPDSSGRPGAGKPKPLKPFVPSEKIPADQAVDFPVDI